MPCPGRRLKRDVHDSAITRPRNSSLAFHVAQPIARHNSGRPAAPCPLGAIGISATSQSRSRAGLVGEARSRRIRNNSKSLFHRQPSFRFARQPGQHATDRRGEARSGPYLSARAGQCRWRFRGSPATICPLGFARKTSGSFVRSSGLLVETSGSFVEMSGSFAGLSAEMNRSMTITNAYGA